MHMADALLSPAVGGVMTAVSAGAIGYSVKKLTGDSFDEKKIPMMGVMGAFVFAGQMINFTIPGTGSSGHIGGGILLTALLGPFPALLTLSAVLLIQALFFADGGLLALGCNVFNIGVLVCLLAYPLLFKPFIAKGMTRTNIMLASILSTVVGLQLGSFGVVLQTLASGVTELPFGAFTALMQPIHLAIGVVEGCITAAVLCYVHKIRPEVLDCAANNKKIGAGVPIKKVLVSFVLAALLVGGGLSLFASENPDGLEWSMLGVAGTAELERDDAVHSTLGNVANATAIMPDYSFWGNDASGAGTATAGIVGSTITILLAGGIGLLIHFTRKKTAQSARSSA